MRVLKLMAVVLCGCSALLATGCGEELVGPLGPPPPAFVLIPAGTFTMGSPQDEPGRRDNETQHEVTLTKAFYMGVYEVTQAEWVEVMGWNPSRFNGGNRPVERVTWYDCIDFCNRRSESEGLTPAYELEDVFYDGSHITWASVTWNQEADGYRLPTEAEWEYACRAGSRTAFCNGPITQLHAGLDINLAKVGWYLFNSGNETRNVGTRSPNAWGLYDMHGNVSEWCWDPCDVLTTDHSTEPRTDPIGPSCGAFRQCRGGSYSHYALACRSASRPHHYERLSLNPWFTGDYIGFRLARTAF